ncbi:MAG: patatin-like phospholipase family protein, partial [Dehalococcoidia bacterium]
DTETWLIEPGDFISLFERYPELWRNLGRILSQRLIRTSRRLSAEPHTNTAALIMDCADDEAAALAAAIAVSLARQTGRRILLVDGRAGSTCSVSQVAPGKLAPSFSEVLADWALLKQHETPPDRANGVWGARFANLRDEDGAGLTEHEIGTVLESLRPLYDHILILVGREAGELGVTLFEQAGSILALVTQDKVAGVPPWLDSLCQSPDAQERLEVAMMVGGPSASSIPEAVEERVGRPVRRLRMGLDLVRRMAKEGEIAAEAPHYRPLRQAVDRLARHIGKMEVGLALGAGGAKGFAHIGVLRVLEENAVPVDYIAGCSIGAIVGVQYALGLDLTDIQKRLDGVDRKLVRWTLPLRSVWSDAGLKEVLRDPMPKVRFRDLSIPLAAVATDIATGREVVLRKGLVWRALQASSSIPGIFPPVVISGRRLVDGGLVNPVPSQTVRDLGADIVVAVDLMSPAGRTTEDPGSLGRSGKAAATKVPNLLEMLWRSTEIMQEEVSARSAATADVTIEPKLGQVSWGDFSRRGQDFVAAGEEAAREKLPELRRLLPRITAADRESL